MLRLLLCLALLSAAVSTIATVTLTHTSAHANAGNASVPAAAVSLAEADTHRVREFPIAVKDVVFDRNTAKFYASIPSSAGAMGNSIAKIDPTTGQVENSVFVGSEPGKLALSDDGHTLYVSLDGAAAVRKFDITTQTAGQQFPLGDTTFSGLFFVKDLAVAPGQPDVVAVSRKNMTSSPDFEGVAIYDHGVQRTLTTPRHTGSDFIAFSASASMLFGSGADFTGLQKMSVTPTGVSVVISTPSGTGGDFKFDNGFMYLSFGQVINGSTMLPAGTFTLSGPLGGPPQVEPDSSVGRVYFLTGDSGFGASVPRTMTIQAFDQNTFLPVGSLAVPNVRGAVTSLIRWGANGLAFGTTGGQFFVIQTTLVPSAEPVPTPTSTPSPSPTPTATPTPTPGPGQLREVQIVARDIVIDAAGTIYASVPSTVGAGGNSIAPIDPIANAVGQPVFVGSEPNRLAISDNGQLIYVGLDGARAIRRFDVPTRTPGLQFPVDAQGQDVAIDLAVAPGQPQTVAAARASTGVSSDEGVAIYDDGIKRPNVTGVFNRPNFVNYSANSQILYGLNSDPRFYKLAAASCGVTILSVKDSLLTGGTDFEIENGLAFSASGRVADPEAGTLIGTYPVTANVELGTFPSAVIADSAANRVYFFMATSSSDVSPNTMFIRAFDMKTFLEVGTLALPNISGKPTAAVRWGADGFAFRTNTNKVYLIQTSLIPSQSQPVVPAPAPTPPTYTLRGTVSGPFGGPPLPTFTVQLSGGQTATTTTNADGSFAFTGLPFCTDFVVTPIPSSNYTFNPASLNFPVTSQNNPNAQPFFNAIPPLIGFSVTGVSLVEGNTTLLFSVTRNNTSSAATVDYQTSDGTASERTDYSTAIGTLRFDPGQATKFITVFVNDDVLHEANETFTLSLSNPSGAFLSIRPSVTVTIADNDATDGTTNPADDATFFVRQHYRDFLSRDPDSSGLAFWVNEITSCGTDQQCLDIKRINVSAAFFLSIEFQETGYFAYRAYKAAYGDATSPKVTGTVPVIRLKEFLADAHRLGEGVQVGIGNWQQQLEENKNGYALEFVQRQRFMNAFPLTMTPDEFVSKLDQNTGGILTTAEKSQLIALLGVTPADSSKRAAVLRAVTDDAALRARESNRAFVLMQYYGYLRRNPDDPQDVDFAGWKFWLDKLNQFNGNFVEAEMVKAFITSSEYRHRFGTQ